MSHSRRFPQIEYDENGGGNAQEQRVASFFLLTNSKPKVSTAKPDVEVIPNDSEQEKHVSVRASNNIKVDNHRSVDTSLNCSHKQLFYEPQTTSKSFVYNLDNKPAGQNEVQINDCQEPLFGGQNALR